MTKEQVIEAASQHGITVKEVMFGIFNPEPAYSFAPSNTERFKYRENMYHVSCNRSRSELVSGVRLMAERMKVELTRFPSK